MKRRTIVLILIQFLVLKSHGQDGVTFSAPVKIPMYLSGNFGEIRSDHFHSGIDIKTQGIPGHQVCSCDDGYVSRIKVQSNGYGKSIYIAHPNGYTTVYGHLDRYRDDIASYVNDMQYKQQSQLVDLYLNRETFPVKRDELIAYSGNTGSSSGPHLHFEIRTTANQHPTNVLRFGFDIRDQISPRFRTIHFYPLDNHSQMNGKPEKLSSQLVKENGIYTLPYGTRLFGSGSIGISVEVFDYLDGSSNRCGIYSLEMYVDNELTYSHVMDEFSFSETRYVNAHINYEESFVSGIIAHRLYRLPNDKLNIYNREAGNLPLLFNENRDYPVRIVASDVAGNRSVLEFILKGKEIENTGTGTDRDSSGRIPMKYDQVNNFENGPVRVDIPLNALYQHMDFTFSTSPPVKGSLSPFYHIASREIPVHTSYTLSIKSTDIAPNLRNKLLIVSYDDDREIVAAGGQYKAGAVVAELRNFGEFAISLDTIPPEILPAKHIAGADLSQSREIRFTILDKLSGIARYEGYIDNKWALFEYDPKNDLLIYTFDEKRIKKGTEHELELYVTDSKGNASLLHTMFHW